MKQNEKRDLEIKAFYLAGGTRAEAMEKWDLKTGPMAGISTRNNMHWSWALKNRRSGIKPLSAQTVGPRKPSQTGGGLVTSIQARASRVTKPANIEVDASAPLYETPSPMRRSYGPSTRLSSRQKHEKGIVDSDSSLEKSQAFDGIDSDVAAAFAPFYK